MNTKKQVNSDNLINSPPAQLKFGLLVFSFAEVILKFFLINISKLHGEFATILTKINA